MILFIIHFQRGLESFARLKITNAMYVKIRGTKYIDIHESRYASSLRRLVNVSINVSEQGEKRCQTKEGNSNFNKTRAKLTSSLPPIRMRVTIRSVQSAVRKFITRNSTVVHYSKIHRSKFTELRLHDTVSENRFQFVSYTPIDSQFSIKSTKRPIVIDTFTIAYNSNLITRIIRTNHCTN